MENKIDLINNIIDRYGVTPLPPSFIVLEETPYHIETITEIHKNNVLVRVYDKNTKEEDFEFIEFSKLEESIIDKIYEKLLLIAKNSDEFFETF